VYLTALQLGEAAEPTAEEILPNQQALTKMDQQEFAMTEALARIRVRRIPVVLGGQLSGLLFDLTLPTTGEEGYVDAPQPLLLAALDAVCRLANAMKVRKADLPTADVLERLERTLDRQALAN
jgi:hypothetical protein